MQGTSSQEPQMSMSPPNGDPLHRPARSKEGCLTCRYQDPFLTDVEDEINPVKGGERSDVMSGDQLALIAND